MGEGIAHDMLTFLLALIRGGRGYHRYYITDGAGKDLPIGQEVNEISPAITLVNMGTTQVKFGINGVADAPLVAGASITWRWKNPRLLRITVNDGGAVGALLLYG